MEKQEFDNQYLQELLPYTRECRHCDKVSRIDQWEDAGECSEGCCDKMRCPICGRTSLFEVGD